ELQKVGKVDLLDMVGAKATAYFASLEPGDLSDETLAQQAKALRQIGEVQVTKARYSEAMLSFTTANSRAAAVVKKNPKNGDVLFERAQAEYWIGFVHRKRGDFSAMGE